MREQHTYAKYVPSDPKVPENMREAKALTIDLL